MKVSRRGVTVTEGVRVFPPTYRNTPLDGVIQLKEWKMNVSALTP